MQRKDASQCKRIVCPFDVKDLDEKGHFTGLGAVFGNVDLGGDRIVGPNPFKKFKYTKDKQIRVLYQHDTYVPVGKSPVEQDDKGLHLTDAQLVMDMPGAPGAYAGMKSGLLDGLSVGFDTLPNGRKWIEEEKVWELTKLELWEVSIVTFGMNPLAKIQSVKAAQNIRTVREFEEFLRDAGFTATQAKKIAVAGFREDTTESQPRDVGEAAQQAADRIKSWVPEERDVPVHSISDLIKAVELYKL